MPSIEEFLSLVRTKNIARTEKFEVKIFGPNINPTVEKDYLTLLCEEASIPGLNIGTRTVRLHNLTVQRPRTIDYMGESASFTFLVDGEWKVRNYFDTWMQKIIKPNREVANYPDIIGRIEINALHEGTLSDNVANIPAQQTWEQHVRYGVLLEEAFPKGINVMPMSYSNSGLQRVQINFAFKYWKINPIQE